MCEFLFLTFLLQGHSEQKGVICKPVGSTLPAPENWSMGFRQEL